MKLTRAGRRMGAVIMGACAAMMLNYAVRGAAMAPLEALPRETPVAVEAGTDLVDINTAGLEELISLPGIGPARARAILEDRAANGPYRYPEDLLRVKGIGEGILEDILDQITTGGNGNAQDIGG